MPEPSLCAGDLVAVALSVDYHPCFYQVEQVFEDRIVVSDGTVSFSLGLNSVVVEKIENIRLVLGELNRTLNLLGSYVSRNRQWGKAMVEKRGR